MGNLRPMGLMQPPSSSCAAHQAPRGKKIIWMNTMFTFARLVARDTPIYMSADIICLTIAPLLDAKPTPNDPFFTVVHA